MIKLTRRSKLGIYTSQQNVKNRNTFGWQLAKHKKNIYKLD